MKVLGFRDVPVDPSVLGNAAAATAACCHSLTVSYCSIITIRHSIVFLYNCLMLVFAGALSKDYVPVVKQVVLRAGGEGPESGFDTSEQLEAALYEARREIHVSDRDRISVCCSVSIIMLCCVMFVVYVVLQGRFRQNDFDFTNAYVCSLSSKTIIYKGMLRCGAE